MSLLVHYNTALKLFAPGKITHVPLIVSNNSLLQLSLSKSMKRSTDGGDVPTNRDFTDFIWVRQQVFLVASWTFCIKTLTLVTLQNVLIAGHNRNKLRFEIGSHHQTEIISHETAILYYVKIIHC